MSGIEDTSSPTFTEQDRIAAGVCSAFEAAARMIPRLEHPHPSTGSWVRAYRTITEDDIAKVIALIEQIGVLRRWRLARHAWRRRDSYAVAKALARDDRSAELNYALESLKSAMRRSRMRRKRDLDGCAPDRQGRMSRLVAHAPDAQARMRPLHSLAPGRQARARARQARMRFAIEERRHPH